MRSSLPDDELSAQGDEISTEGDSSPEFHEYDSSLLHPAMNLTETVQGHLDSSVGEEDVTISASCDEVGTILSSSVAKVTILADVEDNAGKEISIPELAAFQQKDIITDGHGDLAVAAAGGDEGVECDANPEDVLGDVDNSFVSTLYGPVESVIPAVNKVLETLNKVRTFFKPTTFCSFNSPRIIITHAV